jgi:hypothetical protein
MKTADTDLSFTRADRTGPITATYLATSLIAVMFFFDLSAAVQAAGNLMITPTRVVFEQRTRSAQVTLVNQGTETSDFRISFIRQNMTESGQFVPVAEDEAGMFSDTMIRYSPRQVRLPPGQSQVIRLLLRKQRDLEDGEYRSHMLFQTLPSAATTSVENITDNIPEEGITIELIPIVGVSIPIIVRHGDLENKVTLSDVKIKPATESGGSPVIAVSINRTGNSSAYGDFRAIFTPLGGQAVIVAQANKVAVYANVDKRRFVMPLTVPPGFNLVDGTLDIVFLKPGFDIESGTLAETRLVLN